MYNKYTLEELISCTHQKYFFLVKKYMRTVI